MRAGGDTPITCFHRSDAARGSVQKDPPGAVGRSLPFRRPCSSLPGVAPPVEVKWSTETEMNTAGFNLYRSETAGGPFDLKINDQLIPASPDPLTGGDYTYLDRTTQSGITYYYELEEVELTGAVTRHGPIMVKAQGFSPLYLLFATLAATCGIAIWFVGRKTMIRFRRT